MEGKCGHMKKEPGLYPHGSHKAYKPKKGTTSPQQPAVLCGTKQATFNTMQQRAA
jgi:hypothetical protein